jgi:signal transduction histidine kinase
MPLRLRVMIAFGLVSMLVSGLVAITTWNLSSSYLLDNRQGSAVRQAEVNARLVQASLQRGSDGLPDLLTGLGSEVESAVLLVDRGQWISSGNLVDPKQLPAPLLAMVEHGQPARQRTRLDGVPVLAVGLPLPNASATYVEIFPLRELDRTFHFLSWMLIAGVIASGLAGALLGRWAAGRALYPLRRLTTAAAAAAGGDLAVRLPDTRDPDLAPLAQAFNDTAERLQRRVLRDARFATDVSHELRSPLTTMTNAMAVLQHRRGELSSTARQALDLLDLDLHRFQQLVEDLLEISRADQGAADLALEQLDLAELVARTAEHCTRDAAQRLRADTPHPLVLVDRRRLERAVANLITNADQHGGGLVRLGVGRHAGNARLEVDDAGPGVPSVDREHIFERFARRSAADRTPDNAGTGLGLALVSQHVHQHGGRTWVEDRPGGGARFVVEIPEAKP